MTDEEFINVVARRAAVSTQRAESLTRATLSALSDRLTAGEADDVASQLPKGLKEAMTASTPEAEPFGLEESSTGSVGALGSPPRKPRSERTQQRTADKETTIQKVFPKVGALGS